MRHGRHHFDTSTQTFRKLIGNGLVHRVPPFQRDYSWTEEDWEDLWQDILAVLEPGGEQGHYLGYLVLQSEDDRTHDIVDGQQRITTLSVLVLAVLNNLGRLIARGVDVTSPRSRPSVCASRTHCSSQRGVRWTMRASHVCCELVWS